MPRSPSAPSEPYLKCSSSLAKTSFSSRKNFIHVKKAPSAIKITSAIAETKRMRFVFGRRLIGVLSCWSKCFQIFDDGILFWSRQRRSVCRSFMAGVRIPLVAIARGQAIGFRLRVELKISARILGIILAAPILIEAAHVRNECDLRLVEYVIPAVENGRTFCARI